MTGDSPYRNLPPHCFWKTGVAGQDPGYLGNLYQSKWGITPETRIVTAGSCFAQHIARQLRKRGYNVVDKEPAPPGLSPENARRFGYDLYSARYGNIYTVKHLLQLTREAFGRESPPEIVWEKSGRYFDAFRPNVEPEGLESPDEVLAHRTFHLKHVHRTFREAQLFIFTLGLTEAWIHTHSGFVFPTCPGTVAGTFDSSKYSLKNFTFSDVKRDFLGFRNFLKNKNPDLRFILTVSPVPLVATAAGSHVLQATTHSKSVLRAVAGELAQECEDIDYFPAYEVIASASSRGAFFESDLRSVNAAGVEAVMRAFFGQQPDHEIQEDRERTSHRESGNAKEDVVCEEILLEAFEQ